MAISQEKNSNAHFSFIFDPNWLKFGLWSLWDSNFDLSGLSRIKTLTHSNHFVCCIMVECKFLTLFSPIHDAISLLWTKMNSKLSFLGQKLGEND